MSNNQAVDFVIEENLTDVQEFAGDGGGPPALPVGEYVGDVVSMVQGTSKSQNGKVTVTFEVVEPAEFAGKTIQNNYSLLPNAIGRLKKLGLACGAKLDAIRSAEYIGSRVRFAVIHNPGQQMVNPDGTFKLGVDGQPLPPRIFANVCNERPLEEIEAQPAVMPPPVTKKATNGQPARRA